MKSEKATVLLDTVEQGHITPIGAVTVPRYLPSICEMGPAVEHANGEQGVVLTLYGLGDLSGAYWSSAEINATTAWLQNFAEGDDNAQLSMAKDFQLSARCVRRVSA